MKKDLIKHPGVNPLLNSYEQEFVVARSAEKVMEMEETACHEQLLQILSLAFAELGSSPTGTHIDNKSRYLNFIARLLKNDIKGYFPQVTIREVAQAVKRGIRREYGDFFGFSVVAIHTFIEKYLASEIRAECLKKQDQYLLMKRVPEELPVMNKWEIFKFGLVTCYENYKKSKRIQDCGNINYEFLVKAGEINLDNDDKNFIFTIAEQQVKREQDLQLITHRLAYRMMQQMQKDKSPVIVRCKEIALKNYYDTNPDFDRLMDKFYETFTREFT